MSRHPRGKYEKGAGCLGPKSLCTQNDQIFPTVNFIFSHDGHFGPGLNRSGVDPPLSSSRACLTTFIATQFLDCACHSDSALQFLSLPSALNGVRVGLLLQGYGLCRLWTEFGA